MGKTEAWLVQQTVACFNKHSPILLRRTVIVRRLRSVLCSLIDSHLRLFHARILLPLLCHQVYSLLEDTEGELVAFHQNYKNKNTRLHQFRLILRYIKIKYDQKISC